jgi:2'-deoxymugineic-acid 2'-dioxygenase/mugineic-acid 3-dioxygenase
MELISNATAPLSSVPNEYVFPPEKRASFLDDLSSNDVSLPLIDLHHGALSDGLLRRQVATEIVKAGKQFGFFQVVNHGVGEDVVQAFRDASSEFFTMPAEDKLLYCSDDQSKPFRVASKTPWDRNKNRYWRDYLKLVCYPIDDELVSHWPSKPASFRSSLADYSVSLHELSQTLLELIAEGLGLDSDFFGGDLSRGNTQMNVNYYPPCPDPSLTMGLLPHCDRNLLTMLSQGDVAGLQVRHDGRWILIRPVPGVFVVNFGHQIEIVTNGALASVEHRVFTNSDKARLSLATLVHPRMDCLVGPAPEMVSEENPAKFRKFVFSEFYEAFDAAAGNREDVLASFKIHRD